MTGRVCTDKEDQVGWLIFDHPERRNAITVDMWRAIPDAVAELDDDDQTRVIVLRGHGEVAFVSGADISEFEETRTGSAAKSYDALTHAGFDAIRATNKPVVAMIHGFCIGGGAAICLCADLRYAADDAVFSVPPAKLGLGYHTSGIEALGRATGYPNAAELLFTGKRFDAAEAQRIGFVHHTLPKAELETEVRRVATTIAQNAPLTIQSAKINLRELGKPASERDPAAMQDSIDRCMNSVDFTEGVTAFLQKRRPRFEGR